MSESGSMAQASSSSYSWSAVSHGVYEGGASPRYDSFGKYERTDRASGIEGNGMGTEAIRPIATYAPKGGRNKRKLC